MRKYNRFSVLKLVLCCLFFAATAGVFGVVVVNEPDSIKNMSGSDFYAVYDQDSGLYFAVERITRDNVEWWGKWLAYESYMYFGLKAKFDSSFKLESAYSLYFRFFNEITENHKFLTLLKEKGNTYRNNWDEIEKKNKYLQYVLNMFYYNLSHYTDGGEGATWVEYVSSRKPLGPLYTRAPRDLGYS